MPLQLLEDSNKQNSLNAKNSLENNLANNGKYNSSQQNTNTSEISLSNTNQSTFHIPTYYISKEIKEKLKDFERVK